LNSSIGCPKCVAARASERLTKDIEAFKCRVLEKFGDVYDYSNTVYTAAQSKLTVICKNCETAITAVPGNIINRASCCHCQGRVAGGFKDYLPAILYYLKVEHNGEVGYKIGITNKTVAHRYRSNKLGRITILKEWSYAEGKNARNAETRILQDLRVYKWTGAPLLTDGNSEIFDRDVLELEKI
jgi:hypothetical protein